MKIDRRKFLKIMGAAGAASLLPAIFREGLAGSSPYGLPPKPRPPEQLPEVIPQEIRSPLRVAQWYDYWPPSFIESFRDYIMNKYGVSVDVVQEFYTSNEELFLWIIRDGKKFDVIFPTQHTLEMMRVLGLLRPLNLSYVPNIDYLFPEFKDLPWAKDKRGNLYGAPYQWGTTGIGFRTDKGWRREDIEADGYEIFWMDGYKGVDLYQKKMMLDDARDTIGQTYKRLGWKEQLEKGLTPTNIPWNPNPPYNGEYQWSTNETSQEKLFAARDALLQVKPTLFDFNTYQGVFLVLQVVYIATAWSGDIMSVMRPNTSSPWPVDYCVPIQGGIRWVDSGCIPATSDNVFLAHEFINYFLDPVQGARITDWNLYATPNEASFDLLTVYPQYNYDPREDPRIYADLAIGYSGPPILPRCEYQRYLGLETWARYLETWMGIKYG